MRRLEFGLYFFFLATATIATTTTTMIATIITFPIFDMSFLSLHCFTDSAYLCFLAMTAAAPTAAATTATATIFPMVSILPPSCLIQAMPTSSMIHISGTASWPTDKSKS